MITSYELFKENGKHPLVPSGDRKLDELLGGGYHRELIYLLYGDKKRTNDVLHTSIVNILEMVSGKVAYIDSTNQFSPYKISTLALTKRLEPTRVLNRILVSRAFTWPQTVEILENKLLKLDDVKAVIVSGITKLFENYEYKSFEDLSKAINGIKEMQRKAKALVIMTAELHEASYTKPKGGTLLSHFGNVLVLINDNDRRTEYMLIQHPYLPYKKLTKFKPRKEKVDMTKALRNTTLDFWLSKP